MLVVVGENIKYSPFLLSLCGPPHQTSLHRTLSIYFFSSRTEQGYFTEARNNNQQRHPTLGVRVKIIWRKAFQKGKKKPSKVGRYLECCEHVLPWCLFSSSAPRSDVWGGEGGGGKFSRTFNIFFFIHCTVVCLYRILIAKKNFCVFSILYFYIKNKKNLIPSLEPIHIKYKSCFNPAYSSLEKVRINSAEKMYILCIRCFYHFLLFG